MPVATTGGMPMATSAHHGEGSELGEPFMTMTDTRARELTLPEQKTHVCTLPQDLNLDLLQYIKAHPQGTHPHLI